ncbi:hypothetical protein ACF0H5_024415 [Mactra antiquata]
MANPKLNLVVAACNNNGIGINGNLPWRLRKDMDFFKKMTTLVENPEKENAVIMGRKTWFSIPEKFRPLKGRVNIVLSRELKEVPEGVHIARSLPAALSLIQSDDLKHKIENVHVIGGSSVYAEAMTGPYLCRIYLTKVLKDFTCDTFLPEIDEQQFQKIQNPDHVPVELQEENDIKFRFEVYEKINNGKLRFNIMAAMCHGNRGIGYKMGLPWPPLQKDKEYYQVLTSSLQRNNTDCNTERKVVHIMGRLTWLSCPPEFRYRPNVFHVVISNTVDERTLDHPRLLKVVPSFEASVDYVDSLQDTVDSVWIMGGNGIYQIALEHVRLNKLYLTHVYTDFEVDAFFPKFENNFEEISEHEEAGKIYEENNIKFEFKIYKKRK